MIDLTPTPTNIPRALSSAYEAYPYIIGVVAPPPPGWCETVKFSLRWAESKVATK